MSSSEPDSRDVADRLHSAAIHLLRRVRKVDEESGLTAARLSVLSVLVFGGPATLGELARTEQVSAPTMSKLVRGLERSGLVSRESNERDGRSVLLRATEEGRRLLVEARERRISELTALLADASSEELATLDSAATIVESALHPPEVRMLRVPRKGGGPTE